MRNILLFLCLSFICCNNTKVVAPINDYAAQNADALAFCKKNNMNETYYFLVDLSLHPGKNRFFVYDFKEKKITDKNIVTHGSCDVLDENPDKWEKAKFNNAKDSHCSVKGKFKIGERGYSSWGIHVKYILHGLEKSNENAQERDIVLHSWDAVSNDEVYPKVSPLSWGCPAVSNEFMKKLDAKLKASKKPVLLWIVN